jgi:hypothetical protein
MNFGKRQHLGIKIKSRVKRFKSNIFKIINHQYP